MEHQVCFHSSKVIQCNIEFKLCYIFYPISSIFKVLIYIHIQFSKINLFRSEGAKLNFFLLGQYLLNLTPCFHLSGLRSFNGPHCRVTVTVTVTVTVLEILSLILTDNIFLPAVIYRPVVDGGGLPQPHGVCPEHEERKDHHSPAAQGPVRTGRLPGL